MKIRLTLLAEGADRFLAGRGAGRFGEERAFDREDLLRVLLRLVLPEHALGLHDLPGRVGGDLGGEGKGAAPLDAQPQIWNSDRRGDERHKLLVRAEPQERRGERGTATGDPRT